MVKKWRESFFTDVVSTVVVNGVVGATIKLDISLRLRRYSEHDVIFLRAGPILLMLEG